MNVIKVSVPSKLIYKSNAEPTKTQTEYVREAQDEIILNLV